MRHVLRLCSLLLFLAVALRADTPACGQTIDTAALDASIRRHRMGTIVVEAPPGARVEVEQVRHEFWFGAAISNRPFSGGMRPEDVAKYKEIFLENFNAAVTENALKWHSMERRRGEVDYRTVDAILDWTEAHDIPLRGHNIFWGIPRFVQSWIKELPKEELERVVRERALDVGRRYRGRFAEYDLNNEMIHGNYYEDRLGADITKRMADWVREEDPGAVLYLNDYDILTGRRLEDFIAHAETLQAQGAAIDGIGVQGHLHGDSFDPQKLQHALDRLATLDLPIRVTEFNMPGQRSKYYGQRDLRPSPEEEQAHARALADYYRICFAHPAVDGILMWGFWEGANWIPASSLYRRDWTPTPRAEAYRALVFDAWWTRASAVIGARGRVEIPAFYGVHRVRVGDREKTVELERADGVVRVDF